METAVHSAARACQIDVLRFFMREFEAAPLLYRPNKRGFLPIHSVIRACKQFKPEYINVGISGSMISCPSKWPN